jgi:outer membrane protein OmpA-like peptidoglycan-associated protein
MRGTTAARYLFAACLSASTVALLVVNLVLGPMAFGSAAGSTPAAYALVAAGPQAEGPRQAAAAERPPAERTTVLGALETAPPIVVARFEIDQPSASWDDLAFLAATMKADPRRRVVLEGHSDRKGDRAYNRTLSFERARWAQARLVELGVKASRIEVIAHGADRPLADGPDDAAVASNRRVEARWLPSAPDDGDR